MRSAAFLFCTFAINIQSFGAEMLLEDYENGGVFHVSRFDNDFTDSRGRKNDSRDAGKFAEVEWAAKWSGLASTGATTDLSSYRTFQVDVMVRQGEPVEEECNFYFQLLNHSPNGYSYWEFFVPQAKVKADGQWYRIQFPVKKFWGGSGDGGLDPADFKTITGTVCGLTFDKDGDQFEFKKTQFDNLTLLTEEVEDIVVKLRSPQR